MRCVELSVYDRDLQICYFFLKCIREVLFTGNYFYCSLGVSSTRLPTRLCCGSSISTLILALWWRWVQIHGASLSSHPVPDPLSPSTTKSGLFLCSPNSTITHRPRSLNCKSRYQPWYTLSFPLISRPSSSPIQASCKIPPTWLQTTTVPTLPRSLVPQLIHLTHFGALTCQFLFPFFLLKPTQQLLQLDCCQALLLLLAQANLILRGQHCVLQTFKKIKTAVLWLHTVKYKKEEPAELGVLAFEVAGTPKLPLHFSACMFSHTCPSRAFDGECKNESD